MNDEASPVYEYDFIIREKHLGIDVPISIWLYDPLATEPAPGQVLSPEDAEVVMRAMPEHGDWDMQVTPAFVAIRDLLVRHMTEGAGAGDDAHAQHLNQLLRIVAFFDLGVQWLCHFWGKVFSVDSRPVTAAEMRQLFAEQADKIDLVVEEIRPVGQNAVIELVRKRGRGNYKLACIYLGWSDKYLHKYKHDLGDGRPPDSNKLNGRKGPKEWDFAVSELDRFQNEVLAFLTPPADLEGVEISKRV